MTAPQDITLLHLAGEVAIDELKRQHAFMLKRLRRIAASNPNHSQFAILALAEAREAVEFVEERLI